MMELCESPQTEENHWKIYSSFMKAETWLDSHIPKGIRWDVVLIILWIFLVVLNFCRLFYNIFWWDECYSILISHESLEELMYQTQYNDANPPLYYLIMKFFYVTIGIEPFVYNFVSYIPYFLTMILTITVVKKRFGIAPASLVMIFASILEKSLFYTTEARAYQWALFFLFAMIILCYEVIIEPKIWHYIILTVTYICACYTHYYALMCGGALLSAMILRTIIVKDKKNFLLSSASLLISFIAFIPWIPWFLKESNDITTDFWIEDTPTIIDCIIFLFSYNPVSAVFTFFLIITILYLLKKAFKTDKFNGLLSIFDDDKDRWSMVMVTLCGIFGVLIFTTIVSLVKNPMLFLRYIYPISALAWMVIVLFISGTKMRKLFTVLVLILTLVVAVPVCTIFMYDEYQTNADITDTLNLTYPYMDDDDDILTSKHSMLTREGKYYYPGIPITYIEPDIADISHGGQHWLFLSDKIDQPIIDNLERNGFGYETIKDDGKVGPNTVWVYKLTEL